MKFLFTILISSLCFSGFSQIVAPDTVCVGGTFGLTTSAQFATTYTWNFSPTNVNQTVSPFTSIFSGAPLNSPSTGCLVNDGGNYYFFVINYNSEDLIKFNYGTSLYNTPVITNMGNFGMTGSDLGGLDIVKDSATNNWYGLLADYSMMGVLSFGTSPNNVPTYTNTSYPYPTMGWGHHLKIKRYNGNWIAFLANRNANITRFDFGSSLTNPPTTHVLPNVGGMVNPVHFALYEEGGNWYALASNLIAATLIRYDFGPNLMNNAPTGVSLGNPGGYLTLPRGENIYNDCEGHVICYLGDEGGQLIKLDFGTSITSTPVATNLGPTGITHITNFSPYSHGDTMSMVIVDATYGSTGLLWLYTPYIYSTPAITNYYNPNLTYSFPAVGTYHVSLFCDQGFTSGPSVYCKDIVVINGTGTASSHDTTLCGSPPITLYADTVGRYTWSTGDTTFSILASASGTYWNTTFMSACNYKSDTTHVNFVTGISVNLGNDTAFCRGDSFMLAPVIPGGTSLTWSTGATSPSITIDSPGRYWIKVTSGGCIATDTIKVAVNPDPIVNLGPDQSECAGAPITLQPTGTYTSPTYLWNTGSTAATISPSVSGNYWLQVTVAGCTGADTVNVNFKPNPLVSLPSDTAICPGKTLNVGVAEPPGVQYLWSNGSTDSSITISDAGTYTLTVDLNGCKTTASINVTNGVLDSFSLGPDTTACKGDAVELSVNSNAATWSNGKEGPSIMVSFPGTYWVMVPEQCGLVSDTINVDFHMCDIGFPSAFTPNGDGLNDVIGVVGTLKYYTNFSLSIYNRWGQRVFYTEDIYAGWDGIFNGTKEDLGTYFYMIYYSLEGKKHMMKGDFQLIR